MTDPHDCGFFEWHGPAPAEGAEWSPCIGCGTPMAVVPEPPFWPRDVWAKIVEHGPKSVSLTDDDGNEFATPIPGGLWVTLLWELGELLQGHTLVKDWELRELRERADLPAHWMPGDRLP